MTHLLPLLALLTLAGCSQDMAMATDGDAADFSPDTATVGRPTGSFRIAVEPVDGGTSARPVLPAVFGPFLAADGLTLELHPAVRMEGHLRGERATAWSSVRLPTTLVDVPADLTLAGSTPGVRWVTQSDAAGLYHLDVAPDLYQLTVVPHDPLLPLFTSPVAVTTDRRFDLELDLGRPLWGRLVDGDGAPIAGASVHAVDDAGLGTASAPSNADGWYEIHVPDGVWQVVAEPPTGRRLPSRTVGPVEVGESGARLDASWSSPTRALLRVHLTDASGGSLTGADVTLTSVSVDDYGLGQAAFSLTVATDSQGFLETSVPAGVYVVALQPGPDDAWAPLVLRDLRVVDEQDLGTVAVDGFVDVRWSVRDVHDVTLGGAVATCTELDGTHRRWSFDADADGRIAAYLPNTPLDCLVMPPGGRPDLAALRQTLERPSDADVWALGVGDRVGGQVVLVDGATRQPTAYAIVRVLAEDGTVLAQGATDGAGNFTLSVPPAE